MGWGTNEMGDHWNGRCVGANWGTNEMGDQWDGGPLGLVENGWTNEKGDQWEGGPMSSNNVVGDLWIGAPMRRGPMRWGTNEMGDQWVGGTNEMGGQWNEWCMSANWGINEMGDQWDGGPMRWGTNEMGDQWDGGPMMCTRKGHQVQGPPPTIAALKQHIKRAVLQGGHDWGQAMIWEHVLPSPGDWGWTCPDKCETLWTTLAQPSETCQELLHCFCPRRCNAYKCARVQLKCTAYGTCRGDCDNI